MDPMDLIVNSTSIAEVLAIGISLPHWCGSYTAVGAISVGVTNPPKIHQPYKEGKKTGRKE